MECRGRQFASDLVHVGDHEQQVLGCGEGSSQRSGLQRAVHCTSGAALAQHFDYLREHQRSLVGTA